MRQFGFCIKFYQNKCQNGNDCKYKHKGFTKDSGGGKGNGKGEGKNRGRSTSPGGTSKQREATPGAGARATSTPAGVDPEVKLGPRSADTPCAFYAKGECRNNPGPFQHDGVAAAAVLAAEIVEVAAGANVEKPKEAGKRTSAFDKKMKTAKGPVSFAKKFIRFPLQVMTMMTGLTADGRLALSQKYLARFFGEGVALPRIETEVVEAASQLG